MHGFFEAEEDLRQLFVKKSAGEIWGSTKATTGQKRPPWQRTNITISHSFHLEDPSSLGNYVKGVIDSFQQCKHLSRFSGIAPLGKTNHVREQDGSLWVHFGNGFAVIDKLCLVLIRILTGCQDGVDV